MTSSRNCSVWKTRISFLPSRGLVASWFETRGIAALLTMRVRYLIQRSAHLRGVSKDEATGRRFASPRDDVLSTPLP